MESRSRTRTPLFETASRRNTPASWDAYSVWRVRVKQGDAAASALSAVAGWDPYEVWRTRVKRRS